MLFVFLFSVFSFRSWQLQRFHISGQAQGTTYSITYYAEDSSITKASVDSLLDRLDQSLSIYKAGSLINRFNESVNGSVIDHHLYFVVSKGLEISRQTGGLFDITIMPLTQAWGFGTKTGGEAPTKDKIKTLLTCVGSGHLHLQKKFLKKDKACTMIDVNGIAQGYSVDMLAALMEAYGVRNYVVELGGEIRIRGRKEGNDKMKVGIESPLSSERQLGMMQKVLSIDSGAITTSGNYRRFYESEGKKISHLLDPKTGYSISNELISVTVFAKDAITADGYDNALMVMGLIKAMKFVESKPGIAAYFIYRDPEGRVRDSSSQRFKNLFLIK
ncbi:MAG: FAD:protein FMN transferase [Chitinophagaceae bacterium]|nr:MAG: FAD:protein FMN transferase [Chitinophagaceae bacterium]